MGRVIVSSSGISSIIIVFLFFKLQVVLGKELLENRGGRNLIEGFVIQDETAQ